MPGEESSVVDCAEREEVGDAVEVLEAAAALAALARRRRLVARLHLFLPSELVAGRGRDSQVKQDIYRSSSKVCLFWIYT